MKVKDILLKIIRSNRIEILETSECVLTENDKNAKLKKVSISGVAENSLLISTDQIRGLDNLLNKGNGLKQSDYLLLTEFKGKKRAVYFELKSTSFRDDHYIEQFRGVQCICDYIDSIATHFHTSKEYVRDFSTHFVVLHKLPFSKGQTKIKNPSKNSGPESALEHYVDSSNSIHLSEVVVD